MHNAVIGSIFFILLLLGTIIGFLSNQLELFTFLSLLVGLMIVFIFRKKEH